MKVEVRKEPQSRAVLEVELPPEEVSRAVEAAHRRLAQRVNIPGFRRGKAPRHIVERYVGRDSLVDEALKVLLPDGYARAVREAGLAPISRPEISVETEPVDEAAPLRFVATVDVAPEVDPGDYRSVRVPSAPASVSADDVEGAIRDLQLRHATLASSEQPAAQGDFVLVRATEVPEGTERLQSGKEYLVELGGGLYPALLEEGLIGIRTGEERRLEAGEGKGTITVAALDVKRREFPSLDDAFARQVGAESVEGLRTQLRERMSTDAEQRRREGHEDAVLEAVVAQARAELPRSLVEHEAAHLLEDFVQSLARRGLSLETYLRAAEKKEEEMRQEFEARADRRLRTQLVMDEIARREGIEPSEQEIDQEVENLSQSLKQDAARVREWLGDERRRDALVSSLRRRKTVQFLVALASGAEVPAPSVSAES